MRITLLFALVVYFTTYFWYAWLYHDVPKMFLVHLLGGSTTLQRRNPGAKELVDVYCYQGATKSLLNIFQTAKFHLKIENEEFRQYTDGSPAAVYAQYAAESYGWRINPFRGRQPRTLPLDPYNCTCLAINTRQAHDIKLQVIGVDMWRVLALTAGLVLFFASRALSGNPLFFYLCGVAVGVCASFMVLVYYLSKLAPRRMLTYGVLVGGWTVGVYVLQQMWSNVSALLLSYQTHLFWYVLVVGLASFAVCYRVGPPRDQRSKNLVMWTLQVIGLLLAFFSSDYQEATAAIVIVSLIVHYFPERLRKHLKGYWLRRFPPKRRLLSSEEYFEQGAKETQHALDDLRRYCSSPDCAQWRVMLKLNDSKRNQKSPPTTLFKRQPANSRFASFVEGESHLKDNEILEYESSMNELNISSDDSSNTSEDEY